MNTSSLRHHLWLFFSLLIFSANAQVYVDYAAIGSNDGSSWSNAFTDLQTALDSAAIGSEILVAEGIYKPSSFPDPNSTDVRDVAFHRENNVVVIGGYDSSTGSQTETLLFLVEILELWAMLVIMLIM